MKIAPGNYSAKIAEYGLHHTKNAIAVNVTFQIEGTAQRIVWRGNMNDGKSREITFKNLDIMGYDGAPFILFSNPDSGLLNKQKIYNIVVENHVREGKEYTQVKYINDPEQNQNRYMTKEEAAQKIKELGIDESVKAFFANRPKKEENYEIPF